MTPDFASVYQALYLISRGDFNPFSSIFEFYYTQDHVALGLWLLAPLLRLWPSPLAIKFTNDAFTLLAEGVALVWIARILTDRSTLSRTERRLLLAVGIVTTTLNPWTFASDAFDFHVQSIMAACFVSSGFAFYQGKQRLGCALSMSAALTGDVGDTLIVGFALSLFLIRPKAYAVAVALIAFGLANLYVIKHFDLQANVQTKELYAYLVGGSPETAAEVIKAIAANPSAAAAALWKSRVLAYANVAPSGIFGILSPWTAGMWFALFAENLLAGGGASFFAQPGFQFEPGYALLAVGEVWFLCHVVRIPRLRTVLTMFTLVNAVVWAFIWIPRVPVNFLRSTPAVDAKLDLVSSLIPRDAPVYASQGIVGSFAERRDIRIIPIHFEALRGAVGKDTYVVITPFTAIEIPTEYAVRTITCLQADPDATMLLASNETWLFRLRPGARPSSRSAHCGDAVVASAFQTDVATRIIDRGTGSLVVTPETEGGYVLHHAFYRRRSGSYRFEIELSGHSQVQAEVWDAIAQRLVTRRSIGGSGGHLTVSLPFFFLETSERPTLFSGFVPFVAPPFDFDDDGVLELRIWAPAQTEATLNSIRLVEVPVAP